MDLHTAMAMCNLLYYMNRLWDGVDDTVPVLTGGYFEARMKARESRDEARNDEIIIFSVPSTYRYRFKLKTLAEDRSFPLALPFYSLIQKLKTLSDKTEASRSQSCAAKTDNAEKQNKEEKKKKKIKNCETRKQKEGEN